MLFVCLTQLPLSNPLPAQPGPAAEILVAAASDLIAIQSQIAALALAEGIRVRFSFGSSGMLARQIENGAPYDVYLSANQTFVEDLAKQGRIRLDSVRIYAEGRLGLWSKSGRVSDLDSLLSETVRRVAVANPAHAPYGLAAKQALTRRGLWAKLEKKLVYGENVQQAFEFAASGNADAVITAWSLVGPRGATQLPQDLHDPIRQGGGVVAASAHPDAARRLLALLCGPRGQAMLRSAGFSTPGERRQLR